MKVLVAVDSLTTLDVLLNEMTGRSWPAGTEAQVLSVVDDGDVPMKVWREEGYRPSAVRLEMEKRGEEISALAVERLRGIGIPARVVIMRGDPAYLISFAARKWAADLILIRAHNRKDFRRRLLGSVAKSVVESAPCSVEVVRNTDVTSGTGEFRVLLATDGSAASIAASRAIAEMNWPENSEVRVVSAVNPIVYSLEELGLTRDTRTERAHRAIGNAVHALSRAPVRISAEVIAGRAAGRIVERAKHWQAHLIVLGTNERRGFESFAVRQYVCRRCKPRALFGQGCSWQRRAAVHESLQRTKGLQESKKAA
jgi:nucleotide-binding universal stress UspA family protein